MTLKKFKRLERKEIENETPKVNRIKLFQKFTLSFPSNLATKNRKLGSMLQKLSFTNHPIHPTNSKKFTGWNFCVAKINGQWRESNPAPFVRRHMA